MKALSQPSFSICIPNYNYGRYIGGVSRDELIRVFVDQVCIRQGLSQLGRKNYSQAFRLFALALASYPMAALKLPKTYGLMCLLSFGPLALMVGPWLYTVYQKYVQRTSR